MTPVKHYSELVRLGRIAEEEEELEKAAELFESAIKQEPLDPLPYTRLMIIYRKFREPQKELKIIDQGIKIFREHYDHKPEKLVGKNTVAARISRELLRSLDGKKKSDAEPYYPEPVPSWIRRREVVKKKLNKKPVKKTAKKKRSG